MRLSNEDHPALANEARITWLVPLEQLPRYVRESIRAVAFRARRPGHRTVPQRMVGYSELKPDARGSCGMFERRIFWLADHDPYDGGGCPCEAVDPLTVRPGVAGECNDRAAGKGAA